MFDLKSIPFYDDHTHDLDLKKTDYTPLQLITPFIHGFRDVLPETAEGSYSISPELEYHARHMGVVTTMVHQLSARFQCPADLESVTEARNNLTAKIGPTEYAHQLFREANICGSTIDMGWPMGDPRQNVFSGKILRLFQFDPLFDQLLQQCSTYEELLLIFTTAVREAASKGYVGIKCHVAERFSFALYRVSDKEAAIAYGLALNGDQEALKQVYFAVFSNTMLLSQELDLPIQIHSGCTGGAGDGLIHNCDPLLMAPYLNQPEFFNTKIVFLHSNYPNIRNAAIMAHIYPHVWVGTAWVLPWVSLQFTDILREIMGIAPLSKIVMGSGQHNIPEIAWLSANIARTSLSKNMEQYLSENLISESQALEICELLLYKNAMHLYHKQ